MVIIKQRFINPRKAARLKTTINDKLFKPKVIIEKRA
jgi:hypothetical protein